MSGVTNSGSDHQDPYAKLPNPPSADTSTPAAAESSKKPVVVSNNAAPHQTKVAWFKTGSPDNVPPDLFNQAHAPNIPTTREDVKREMFGDANFVRIAPKKPIQNSSTTNVSGAAPLTAAQERALLRAALATTNKAAMEEAVATAAGGAAPVAGPNGKALFKNVMATQVAIPNIDKSGKLTLHVAAGAAYKPVVGGMHIVGGVAMPIHQVIVHDDSVFHEAVTERAESLGIMFQPDPRFMQQIKAQVQDGGSKKTEKSAAETIAKMKGHQHLGADNKMRDKTEKQALDRARAHRQQNIKEEQAQESAKEIQIQAEKFRKEQAKTEQNYQANKNEESADKEHQQRFDKETGRT